MEIKALDVRGILLTINAEDVNKLKKKIHGKVIVPGNAQFDEARQIWNAMIDRRPALIIECKDTDDVLQAVNFAKLHSLQISVRGGGHNIAGRSLQDNVLLVDLSHMRTVKVDSNKKIALVSPGATLADVDQETQAYGLAVPVGINSTTGISGLTLGGGFGWLSRSLGMTVDNLISFEAITVDGEHVVCDREHHFDLFWGVTGGGGNFAIVTSFKFKLHPVGPDLMCGPVIYDMANAKEVLTNYRTFSKNCPEELSVWVVLRNAPPFPFLPISYHGKPVVILVGCYNGPMDEGKKYLSKLSSLGKSLGEGIAPNRFSDFQKAFDPMLTPGWRNYWKSHNFKEISDGLIKVIVDFSQHLPSSATEIFLAQMGGATNRVPSDATAYPHRDIQFIMNVHTRWKDAQHDEKCMTWARDFYNAMNPFAEKGVYVNFISEGDESVEGAYAQNAKRLQEIKYKYDPKNILRSNVNVTPKNK